MFARDRLVFALSLLLCTLHGPAARARPSEVKVQPGDALITLSQRYDVSLDDLRSWNGIRGDRIEAGAVLRLSPPGDSARPAAGADVQVEVKAGDTLSALARAHDCTVADLLEWNPGLEPDRIQVGQQLWLGDALRFETHQVAAGETLTSIARHHRVALDELSHWNPGLEPDRIRVGQKLRLVSRRPRSRSLSVGLPFRGSLKNARRLQPQHGFSVRDPDRAWGTDETVRHLQEAFVHVRRTHPRTPRVEVHDLSARHGGRITDHASHQSGRDADVAYMARECPDQGCNFRRVLPRELSVGPQWELLHYWLVREQVEAVFVDYSLQGALYREARRRGATREQLSLWFQYPRGRGHPGGTVRHAANHADHVHVRFACHRSDPDCEAVRAVAEEARLKRASR